MQEQTRTSIPQPLTFSGVAAFGEATFGRLLAFEAAVAIVVTACFVIAFEAAWVPVINRAIAALPPVGDIDHGMLLWTNSTPMRISGSGFLWITFDPANSIEPSEGADLQVEFGKTELRLRSILGYAAFPYPTDVAIGLNRPDAEPWWGAWHPPLVAGFCAALIMALLTIWAVLGLVYAVPVRLISFYANRGLTWGGAWRVGTACLLPGALVFGFGVLAYGWHHINLVQLCMVAAVHLVVGWIYLLCTPFCLPRASRGPVKENPFDKSTVASSASPAAPPDAKPENPFAKDSSTKSD